MAKAGRIEIDLAANTARFQSDMKKATAALNTNVSHMKRSLDSVDKSFKAASNSLGLFTKGMAALWAAQGAGAVLKLADNYNTLEARIKNATRLTGDFNTVQQELSAISKETGSLMESNVATFQRLNIGAKELGKSNTEVLKLVRTIDQLGVISGASGAAMDNGLMQFSQAMSAGIVRAEEYNSMVENMPAVVERIAKGLGKTQGQLRQMVLDGKLLSKDVFDALSKQSTDIQKEFDRMPKSLAMAMNNLKTTSDQAAGSIDKAFGATQGLAGVVNQLAKSLDVASEFITANKDMLIFSTTAIATTAAIVGLSRALLVLPAQLIAARTAASALATTLSLGGGGLGAVIVGLTAVTAGAYVMSLKDSAEATALAKRSSIDLKSAIEEEAKATFASAERNRDLVKEYDALSRKAFQTTDEKKKMLEITGHLNKQFPNLSGRVEDLAKRLGSMSAAYRQATIEAMAFAEVERIGAERKRIKSAIAVKEMDFARSNAWSFAGSGLGPGMMPQVTGTKKFAALQAETKALTVQLKTLAEAEKEALKASAKLYDESIGGRKLSLIPGGSGSKSKVHKGKTEAEKEMDRLKQAAESLHDRNKTLWERTQEGIALADKLFKKLLISTQDYHREIERLNETVSFKMPELPKLEYDNTDTANKISELMQGKFKASFEEGERLTESLRTAQEKLADELKNNQRLFNEGTITPETLERANKLAQVRFDDATKSGTDFATAIGQIVAEFGNNFFDTIISGFQGAKVSMRDFVSSALIDLSKLIFKMTVAMPVAAAVTSLFKNSNGGSVLGSILTKGILKLPGFADGGNPPVGAPSIVGERGPELFVPKTSGTIVPNHKLGGGGPNIQISQNIYLSTGVKETVRAEVIGMMPAIEKRTTNAIKTAISRGGSMAGAVGRKS